MSEESVMRDRDHLKRKMLEVFRNEISGLSDDFREVFVDDMVTAFQNRLTILTKIQAKELSGKKD